MPRKKVKEFFKWVIPRNAVVSFGMDIQGDGTIVAFKSHNYSIPWEDGDVEDSTPNQATPQARHTAPQQPFGFAARR